MEKSITSQEISSVIKKFASSMLVNIEVFDVYCGKGVPEGKKSVAYTLTFEKSDRTLTDEEINSDLEKIILGLEKKLSAEFRK